MGNKITKELPDGTKLTIDKDHEGKSYYRHGHSGPDFERTEHNAIGMAAVNATFGDKPILDHDAKTHPTRRW